MERRKVKRKTNITRAEEKAELIANEIMMGVQASKYHTCIYDKASNDFNHSHLIQAALKGLRLGLEQKPAEWSEKDKDYYDAIIAKLEVTQDDAMLTDNQMDFLKSLPERFNLQPKHGWRRYIWTINLRFDYDGLVRYEDNGSYEIVTAGNKPKRQVNGEYILLKDIQLTDWKPSKEQMKALEDAKMRMSLIGYGLCPLLQTLINDLKKLL